MASEDEMDDTTIVDDTGLEDFFNDDGDHDYVHESDSDRQNYTVLSLFDTKSRQDDVTSQVSAVLSLSKASSSILLHHFNWDVTKLQEQWFTDEAKVRIAAGLPASEPDETPKPAELACRICLEEACNNTVAAPCGAHWYCTTCWQGYVGSGINKGPGCLSLRCPDMYCNVVVGLDIIENLATDQDREQYSHYLLRSYIDNNPKIKWCPSPRCEYAVEFNNFGDSEKYEVRCKCLRIFCWNCLVEPHRPVDCKTAKRWEQSINEISIQWILFNTKPCPKCLRPIARIEEGCRYMTCAVPCRHKFCWNCLVPMSKHIFSCAPLHAKKVDIESARKEAMLSTKSYTECFDRWERNNKSRLKAIEVSRDLKGGKLMSLCYNWRYPADVGFICEAWEQIAECRRVLQWMNVFGYYHIDGDEDEKDHFEIIQGYGADALEQLHQCVDQEMSYFKTERSTEGFMEYRAKLVGLTLMARKYFDSLVQAVESGLCDIGPDELPGSVESKDLQDIVLDETAGQKKRKAVEFSLPDIELEGLSGQKKIKSAE